MRNQWRRGLTIDQVGGLIILIGILSLAGIGTYNCIQFGKQEKKEQEAIRTVIKPIVSAVQTAADAGIKEPLCSLDALVIKGVLVAWSIDTQKGIILDPGVTPESLKYQKEITLLLRYEATEEKVGFYKPKTAVYPKSTYKDINPAIRISQDICAIYWPGGKIVGHYRLIAEPPEEAMLRGGVGEKRGDIDAELRGWSERIHRTRHK